MKPYLAAAVVALFAAGCSGQSQSSSSTATDQPSAMATSMMTTMPAAAGGSITVKIAELNGSGESGSATLTPMGKKTRVVIAITGESATAKQPSHIHKGPCAKLNPKPSYLLKDVVLGKSTTVVDVTIDKLTAAPMAINVHESAANLAKYVACGDIKAQP